jgi:cell division protein FtsW (lipid II flippase)
MSFFLESYPPIVSDQHLAIAIVFWVGLFVVYFLRKFPIFDVIWAIVSWFLLVLLAVLSANFLKKEIKSWWND